MTEVGIRGQKVMLREKRVEDGEDDHRWRADQELAELDAAPRLRQPLDDFLRDYANELKYPTPWVRRYGIDTLEGLHIGNCMVYDIDNFKGQCEVGILVGNRDYWGRGYGREAVQLLVAQCFKNVAMQRLYLHTLEWNARARRAFAGCGFREVKAVRRAGYNFILMELTREEWEALQDGED